MHKPVSVLLTVTTFVIAVVLSGCNTSISRTSEGSTSGVPRVAPKSQPLPISEKDFKKIPKNLRPEQLEERDDTTVVIRPGAKKTIKEYRINGFLYGILVTPKNGKPYYLVAADHQGNFIDPNRPTLLIPSWTIFQWK